MGTKKCQMIFLSVVEDIESRIGAPGFSKRREIEEGMAGTEHRA
jgi:hypothetical protein